MSTKAIEAIVDEFADMIGTSKSEMGLAALSELEAIRKAAWDLTRLHLGDGVYDVRDRSNVLAETQDGKSTWEHPDVKAWGDAAQLMESIAKEAP